MKLNLGCGAAAKLGYVNVDIRRFEGVDVVADVRDLSFQPESFTEIYAKDLIEHVSFEEAKRLLRNCHGWLKPQGVIIIHTQNTRFLAEQLANNGDYDDAFHFEVLKWMYGTSGEGETNYLHGWHRWGYSKASFSKLLRAIGFTVMEASVDCEGFGLLVVAVKR